MTSASGDGRYKAAKGYATNNIEHPTVRNRTTQAIAEWTYRYVSPWVLLAAVSQWRDVDVVQPRLLA